MMPLFMAMKLIEIVNAAQVIVGFAIVGWLSFMHPDWLLWIGVGTFVPTVFLILICLTPAGNFRLGSATNSINYGSWLLRLFTAQSAFLLITITAWVAFFAKGPDFAQGQFSGELLEHTLRNFNWQWGLLPWGIYGFWAIVLGYATYVKQGVPYLYQIAQGLTFKFVEPSLKSYVEGVCSAATMLSLSLCVSSIILLIAYTIEKIFHLSHFQVPFVTFFILTFLATFFTIKANQKWLLNQPKSKSSYFRIYLITIILAIVFMVGGAWANQWFIVHQAELYHKTICHHCGNYFANVPLETRFAAFYWGWWLIWAPLCGSYLAKISKGRSLREFILGLFWLPAVLSIAYYFWQLTPLYWLLSQMKAIPVSGFWMILAVGTWLIFNRLIAGYTRSDLLISGCMPLPEDMPTSRLWLKEGSKTTPLSKFCQRLFMLVISTLFLHTTAGWYGVQLQVAAMAVLIIYTIYWAFLALVARFFLDKVWINNQNSRPY